jgi:hypothetical protein
VPLAKPRRSRLASTTKSDALTTALQKYGSDAPRLLAWLKKLLGKKDVIAK